MAPSTLVQARISTFESIGSTSTSASPPRASQKYPPCSPDLLEAPISPTASSLSFITPFTSPSSTSRSPSPSPPNLGRKTSLIDLKDWVFDDGPSYIVRQNGAGSRANGANGTQKVPKRIPGKLDLDTTKIPNSTTPLINL